MTYVPAPTVERAAQKRSRHVTMTKQSPNDTRYPFVAVVSGVVAGAGLAGVLLLLPFGGELWTGVLLPAISVLGGVLTGASIKFADQWEKAVVLRLGPDWNRSPRSTAFL